MEQVSGAIQNPDLIQASRYTKSIREGYQPYSQRGHYAVEPIDFMVPSVYIIEVAYGNLL
jgi:hypothetical protein